MVYSGQCMKVAYQGMTTAFRGGLTTVTVVVLSITITTIENTAATCYKGVTKFHTL
ncbi:hypothetical protein Ahy_A01g001326 isoform B [Arachis hypogaea]|uniref:Uncharacterized protein n=1 Tax=Arachis hypogaea TaxID=3818 RepID=A0A445EMS7_ARAHY|nr:hypothetical protein Ahy_A01g001326 isoform B [Arachis hypogaea]